MDPEPDPPVLDPPVAPPVLDPPLEPLVLEPSVLVPSVLPELEPGLPPDDRVDPVFSRMQRAFSVPVRPAHFLCAEELPLALDCDLPVFAPESVDEVSPADTPAANARPSAAAAMLGLSFISV